MLELAVALLLVGFIFVRLRGEISPVLYNRDLLLIYIAAIAILWNLWFFGFWSVSIIADAAQSSFLQAALTAAFNAGAGILVSFVLLLFVREPREEVEAPAQAQTRLGGEPG